MEVPEAPDPQVIKEREDAKEAMKAWKEDVEQQFAEEIKAKKGSVVLSADGDILDVLTQSGHFRIVYNPKDNAERPYQQYAFQSKDDFYDKETNPSEMPRYVNLSKESVGKLIYNLKEWLEAQERPEKTVE